MSTDVNKAIEALEKGPVRDANGRFVSKTKTAKKATKPKAKTKTKKKVARMPTVAKVKRECARPVAVAGVSRHSNGVLKVRFVHSLEGAERRLTEAGNSEINLVELSGEISKLEAVRELKVHTDKAFNTKEAQDLFAKVERQMLGQKDS